MSEHSPGPWRFSDKTDVQHTGWLFDATGDTVLWTEIRSQYDDDLPTALHVDNPADRALIADAPAMLELLRDYHQECMRCRLGRACDAAELLARHSRVAADSAGDGP